MKYVHAVYGGFFSFIAFSLIAALAPFAYSSGAFEVILTASTFLFAILAGFYLSRLNSRYDNTREIVAEEDALWLSLYRASIFFGNRFRNTLRELIDKYYIIAYDHDVGNYYKHNAKYHNQIYDELNKTKMPKGGKASLAMPYFLEILSNIETSRNKSSVIAAERLSKGQWASIVLLGSVILFSLFLLRTPDFYSQTATVLLSTTLILVLLILRDLQNYRLGGSALLDESGEEVFEYIGKLKYYNKKWLDEGTVKIQKNVKKYRLGLHKPGEKPNIKIVNND
ncbi:MAG: hypothetical protein HY514_04230 [Candidatus Aenigmarchaeota archaeon]|nr:hypothetical protein [Candidatus Aenigmarchaeota archaeon]